MTPGLTEARARLEAALADHHDTIATSAHDGMLAALEHRLRFAVGPTRAVAHQLAARLGGGIVGESAADWAARLEQHPVLAQVLQDITADWLSAMSELCDRFAADRDRLEAAGVVDRPARRVVSIQGGAGDPHSRGRSVTILTLCSGERVVYKPRDVRLDRATMEVVAWLNARGLSPALHVLPGLALDTHAWSRHLRHRPCDDRAGVVRFYTRFGMWVRLLQLLEARDLWLDNLLAVGDHPVFFDLETVLSPRRARAESPSRQAAADWLAESSVPTALLSQPMLLRPGIAAEDIGAVTPPRRFRLPLRVLPGEPDDGALRHFTRESYAPTLDDQPAPARAHLAAIAEGYRRMQRFLQANPGAPFASLSGLPVRYLHRGTMWAWRACRASLHPRLLSSPERRRDFLAQIPPRTTGEDPRLLSGEREAIARVEIPLLTGRTDADAVWTERGERIGGFFSGTAAGRLSARLSALDRFDTEAHLSLTRAALACGHHGPWRLERRPLPAVDHREAAVAGADRLLSWAITGSDGSLSWIGIRYDPAHALCWPAVLGADVWTGAAGIAVVLAEVHRRTGLQRFADGAAGALRGMGTPTGPSGLWSGTGAAVLARRRCRLSDPIAADDLEALLRHAEQAPLDVATGSLGLLLALMPADAADPLLPAARRLARHVAARHPAPPVFVPGDPRAAAAPSLEVGLSVAAEGLRRCGVAVPWSCTPPPIPAGVLTLCPPLPIDERWNPSAVWGLGATVLAHLRARWPDTPDLLRAQS